MNNAIKSTSVLMLAAMIWGFAFVAQRSGMEHVGPFFFNGVRTLLGALTLVALLLVQGAAKRGKAARGIPPAGATGIPPAAENGAPPTAATGASPAAAARAAGKAAGFWNDERKALLWGGFLCGLVLFAGSNFQQIGLVFTTASKAGFITTLYIVLVPIFGIFLKQQTRWNAWVGVALSAVGLYCLCITESFSVAPGDPVVLIGAAFWAVHIFVIDRFVRITGAIRLSCVQFAVCGALSLMVMPFADPLLTAASAPMSFESVRAVLPAILYTGILSSGAGFTLQAVGQKYAKPTAASIILSTEAIFGVMGGFLLLGERLTAREALGCVLMFAAVILAQLPLQGRSAKKKSKKI